MPEGEHSHHHGSRGPALATEAAEHEASARVLHKGSPYNFKQPVKILRGETRVQVRQPVLQEADSRRGPPLLVAIPKQPWWDSQVQNGMLINSHPYPLSQVCHPLFPQAPTHPPPTPAQTPSTRQDTKDVYATPTCSSPKDAQGPPAPLLA